MDCKYSQGKAGEFTCERQIEPAVGLPADRR